MFFLLCCPSPDDKKRALPTWKRVKRLFSAPHLSFPSELAPCENRLPWLHRAAPSATLGTLKLYFYLNRYFRDVKRLRQISRKFLRFFVGNILTSKILSCIIPNIKGNGVLESDLQDAIFDCYAEGQRCPGRNSGDCCPFFTRKEYTNAYSI